MDCKFRRNADGLNECVRCGFVDKLNKTEIVYRRCPHWSGGLGNFVAAIIDVATLGQGKRLANAVARRVYGRGCKCSVRQEQLNSFGRWLVRRCEFWLSATLVPAWLAVRDRLPFKPAARSSRTRRT